jgi:hypothetical protein
VRDRGFFMPGSARPHMDVSASGGRPALPRMSYLPRIACQLGSTVCTKGSAVGVVPFISQMTTDPLVFWNKMSDLPSPLKSPVPITCQLGPGLPITGSAMAPSRSSARWRPSHRCFEREHQKSRRR